MDVREHQDYVEEKAHLDEIVGYLSEELQESVEGYGANDWSRFVLEQMNRKRRAWMVEVRRKPFFGRVDWLARGKPACEVFYIGTDHIPETNIYHWADSLAGRIYSELGTDHEDGKLLLKRTFVIIDDDFQTIRDELVVGENDTILTTTFTDTLLNQLLKESRSGKLHDIVATIQDQQYRIIRLPREQTLVIQGSPGSGKTSIALHRVAYLLYHHRTTLKKLLILAPNAIFLGYITEVLPSLGEQGIPQATFERWMIDRIEQVTIRSAKDASLLTTPISGRSYTYVSPDRSLESLLSPDIAIAEKVRRYRCDQLKGSLKMAELLDRYVEHLCEAALTKDGPLTCSSYQEVPQTTTKGAFKYKLTPEDMRSLFDRFRTLPFNKRKDEISKYLIDLMLGNISRQIAALLPPRPQSSTFRQHHGSRSNRPTTFTPHDWLDTTGRDSILQSVKRQVETFLSKSWRARTAPDTYISLFRSPDLLRQLGKGLFDDWEIEILAYEATGEQPILSFCDLAAMTYLKIRLDGVHTTYDHIVVDEAQDLPPILFRVLRAYNPSASMSILGDLAQGVYAHQGVQAWDEFTAAVGSSVLHRESIQQSYRSTQAIVDYGRKMLERLGEPTEFLAKSLPRPGPDPTLHSFDHAEKRAAFLASTIQQELHQGTTAIACITKTADGCRKLGAELRAAGFTKFQILDDRSTHLPTMPVIIPSYLTKGLEFDVVIIADADDQTYPLDKLHARLLYVALTRAAHRLHICWIGTITPFLAQTEAQPTLQPSLNGRIEPCPVTIDTFAKEQGIDADQCVRQLALMEKLPLLRDGHIDRTLLALLTVSFVKKAEEGEQR